MFKAGSANLRLPQGRSSGVQPMQKGSSALARRPVGIGEILLLVDAGALLRDRLSAALLASGYRVSCADYGMLQHPTFTIGRPDAIIFDVSSEEQYLSVCSRLLGSTSSPVVLVVSHVFEPQLVDAIRFGVADFVSEPVDVDEVVVRIELVRKWRARDIGTGMNIGPLVIYPDRRRVDVRGTQVHFAAREYDLLVALALEPGRIRTREELLTQLWGEPITDTKTLDVHVRRLRQKVEVDPLHPCHIVTVRGIGYYFDADASRLVGPEGEAIGEAVAAAPVSRHSRSG